VPQNKPEIKIAPSILSADFARLGEQVVEVSEAGADYIHVDVMDGHFVPNITIGSAVVKAIRGYTEVPLDVHLMIEEPQKYIKQFVEAGADIITFHAEAASNLREMVSTVKGLGVKAGVSINPETPVEKIIGILPYLDLVLVMSVHPGFGGQSFIESSIEKIERVRAELDSKGLTAELEVDGGINAVIAPGVVKAGARVLVAGAAIFKAGKPVKEALQSIRDSLK
jgi:ribulose-phosphate 3-epimerase